MKLNAEQLSLIKIGYVNYRLLKTKSLSAKVLTAEMQATINALESKLATRGRIKAKTPSKLVVPMAKLEKHIQASKNAELGREALAAFLEGSGIQGPQSGALALMDELELLAHFVCETYPRVKWIPGPLKVIDKAMSKTVQDYDYAWGLNKDLVRGTVACGSQDDLRMVADLIKQTCMSPALGMHLIKQDDQKSIRDGGGSVAGYSGWNFVVQFRDHPLFGAEVQANTYDMMYGKMSKAEFCRNLQVSATGYEQIKNRLKFPGGLGHAFYDIQDGERSVATAAEQKLARDLSLDYNDASRGVFRDGSTLVKLNERLVGFWSKLTTEFAKGLWKKAVEGSDTWPELRRSLTLKFHVAVPVRPVI